MSLRNRGGENPKSYVGYIDRKSHVPSERVRKRIYERLRLGAMLGSRDLRMPVEEEMLRNMVSEYYFVYCVGFVTRIMLITAEIQY
jgi:hypothetical protein